MKIRTLVLGEYGSPPTPFRLYMFPMPLTPPLTSSISSASASLLREQQAHFLCLEDVVNLFGRATNVTAAVLLAAAKDHQQRCQDIEGRSYLMTSAVAQVAGQLSLDPSLIELCQLVDEHAWRTSAADLLRHIPDFKPSYPSAACLEQDFSPVAPPVVLQLSPPAEEQQKPEPHQQTMQDQTTPRQKRPFDPCRDDVAR